MHAAAFAEDFRLITYLRLMGSSRQQGFIDHALASMLASHLCGAGAMPARLGLDADAFGEMLAMHFPGYEWPEDLSMPEWDRSGMPEYDELKALFDDYRIPANDEQSWWPQMLIAGCCGRNHLWEDLGLFERSDLNELMQAILPALAAKNSRDMKWKKFLYKQLCEREGIVACPAPTCDQCAQFSECFAPED